MSMYDVPKGDLIVQVAGELKNLPSCKQPVWAPFVKTGAFKERPPVQADWWYVRLAAVLRRVAERGPVGVSKLRKLYSGKKNRGFAPERTYPGSGNILRKSLQQLEKAGLVKHVTIGVHKGRVVTPQGMKMLDAVAKTMMEKSGFVLPKKKAVPAPVVEKAAEEPKKPVRKRAPRKKKTEQPKQEAQPQNV